MKWNIIIDWKRVDVDKVWVCVHCGQCVRQTCVLSHLEYKWPVLNISFNSIALTPPSIICNNLWNAANHAEYNMRHSAWHLGSLANIKANIWTDIQTKSWAVRIPVASVDDFWFRNITSEFNYCIKLMCELRDPCGR